MRAHLFRPLYCSLMLTLLAAPASAQILFTVTGTAQSTTMGYMSGNNYTFTFTLNNYSPTSPAGSNTSNRYSWTQSDGSDPLLFSSVTGDGLTGSWDTSPGDPDNSIYAIARDESASDESRVSLSASTTSGTTTGLTVNGENLYSVGADIYLAVDYFDTSGGSLPNPATYFSAYLGSPTVYSDQQTSRITVSDSEENDITFTVSSLTISAIPEPSTYALLAGLVGLVGAIWHRRRRATAPQASL